MYRAKGCIEDDSSNITTLNIISLSNDPILNFNQ